MRVSPATVTGAPTLSRERITISAGHCDDLNATSQLIDMKSFTGEARSSHTEGRKTEAV
jgi:hypothetical protein